MYIGDATKYAYIKAVSMGWSLPPQHKAHTLDNKQLSNLFLQCQCIVICAIIKEIIEKYSLRHLQNYNNHFLPKLNPKTPSIWWMIKGGPLKDFLLLLPGKIMQVYKKLFYKGKPFSTILKSNFKILLRLFFLLNVFGNTRY